MDLKFIKNIEGYSDKSVFDIYEHITKEHSRSNESRKYVEVGCWKGKSVCRLAMYAEIYKIDTEIFAVDTWKGSSNTKSSHPVNKANVNHDELYQEFLDNVENCKFKNSIKSIPYESIEAAEILKKIKFDLCFIDAEHTYNDVLLDMFSWFPLVKSGGLIAGHDYGESFPGVKRAVDAFFNILNKPFSVAGKCWMYRKD